MHKQTCLTVLAVALVSLPAVVQADEALGLRPFADALDACATAEGSFRLPNGPDFTFVHAISGEDSDGACHYVQHGLNNIGMECAFSPVSRREFADGLRELDRGLVSFIQHPAWESDCVLILADGERVPMAGPEASVDTAQAEPIPAFAAFADALDTCTPANAEIADPNMPDSLVVYSILGEINGACHYSEMSPIGIGLDCAFSSTGRQAFAVAMREFARNPQFGNGSSNRAVWMAECEMVLAEDSGVPAPALP